MMPDISSLLNTPLSWMQNNRIWLLIFAVISVVTFAGTLFMTPLLIVRLPADYFAHRGRRRRSWLQPHPLLKVILLLGKNLLGVVLLLAGVMMLVLPGQGILTILIGMTLIDFPGKYRLERWLVSRQLVRRSINWLRYRAGRPGLELDDRAN